jgi:hypothetical protein
MIADVECSGRRSPPLDRFSAQGVEDTEKRSPDVEPPLTVALADLIIPLRWDLISKYDNAASSAGRRTYKGTFGDLPTVDHVGDGVGAPDFRICAWRINDAKNDLTYEQFVALCRAVLAHHDRR